MAPFKGFLDGKVTFTGIPNPFFGELLPAIDHLGELKVTLYAFWRLNRMEGTFRYLRRASFLEDARFLNGLGPDAQAAGQALDEALERCVRRGTFLKASLILEDGEESYYFLNTPKGRAAVQAIQRGEWRHSGVQEAPLELDLDRPNIFRLYEENIGPLTPLIAEQLRDAEATYPATWIEDAIRIAVENNARRWSYVEAILNRWQEGGRDERTDRRDTEKDRRRYIEGEYSDIIEH
jgi:DnaD/phage-associated family protein